MAFVKNYLHCVWGTRNRTPFLKGPVKYELINHIRINAREKGVFIDTLNGHSEHMHCLLALSPEQSLSKVMQLIKGESAYWLNRSGLVNNVFKWAEEYFAVSVSEAHIPRVRSYIKNQEKHHADKTWIQEYEGLLHNNGFTDYQG